MDHQVILVSEIRRSAADAIAAHSLPDSCPYPQGSAARDIWMQEYRDLYSDNRAAA